MEGLDSKSNGKMNTKASLLEALDDTDQRTRELLNTLDDSQLNVPYEPGINPPIWELGHAAFFYEYFILRALDRVPVAMPGFDEIWDSFEIPHRERWKDGVVPDKATTFDYYARTLEAVRKRIETHDLVPTEHYLYKYGIFHQHMHIESMIWGRQTLGYASPPTSVPVSDDSAKQQTHRDIDVEGGTYVIGLEAESANFATTGFGFDNEKPAFEIELKPFGISPTLVSNREYLTFVEANGYTTPEHWSVGGRRWLERSGALHPRYWKRQAEGDWQLRFFDAWHPLPQEAPIMHVSYWEAEAYCRWAERRLPTEFEWEAAARGRDGSLFPWGNEDPPTANTVDMDGRCLGRQPVTNLSKGASASGCLQMIGTAWEWTSSQFLPYPGFCVDMYPYMSTLQFGDHKVTRGGSCATSSCLIRSTYRQAYYPDRNDVFTSFRTCALA